MGESVETSPCLSLWERWPSAARTERVNVEGINGRFHSTNAARPSQSRLRRASSPRGRAKGAFLVCFPSAPVVPTMRNAIPRLIHRLWRSPFPEGEGFAWYRSSTRVVFATSPERHIGRSLRFRWWVHFSTNGFQKRSRPSPITVNCQL